MTPQLSPNASQNPGFASLLRSLIQRVLRTESPCTLLANRTPDDWVPEALLLPGADIVELSGGVTFVDDMESYLGERRRPGSVLLLPPLQSWRSLPPEFRRRHPRRALHEVVVERALDLVPAGTPIAALLPVRFFSSEALRSFRATLQCHLRVVIEHEQPWPGLRSGFRIHTAVFEKGRDEVGADDALLRFFRVPAGVAHDDHRLARDVDADLGRLLARKGGPTSWGFVLREGLPPGEPWVFDLYSPQTVALQDDLRELGELRPLADLADFVPTSHLVACRASLLDPEQKGGVALLEGRNITQEGSVLWDPTRHRIQEPDVLLRPGDICLRAIWSPATQLVCAQIPSAAPPLAAANTLIVLRRKEETTAEEWQVLVEFLQSPRAADLMAPRALGSIHLSHRALAELPVPVPDQALRVALRTLTDAAADFELWRRETERQKRALFSFAASQKGRLHLMQAGKRARQRQRAGKSVEALAFRVRTQYPHPLAYRWRTVEAGGQGLEDYQNVLDCAEATLCYLALLAVVGARSHRLSIGQLAQIGGRLTERNRGIGLGDWVAVLREVGTSTKFRDLNTFPFPEVPMVLTDDHTNDAVQRLLDARNDQAHGRGPRGREIPTSIEERCADLEVLLSSVEFLVEYPLRLIDQTMRDSLSSRTLIQFRDLMGDHPLVPLASDEHESSEIETRSLYFLDRAGRYHLARPWLSWQLCPECQRPATFHVERYDKERDTVTLKSLEHGHVVKDSSLGPVFRSLGFLQ